VRPPGRQGDCAARGVPGEDSGLPPAFLELGVEDGIIVTRTDSLGAGLTQQIAVSHKPGDLGDQYNSFLDCEEVTPQRQEWRCHHQPQRQDDASEAACQQPLPVPCRHGEDRCVLDSITSLQNGADLLWIETEKPHIEQIAKMVDRIREVIPNAKLAYNNSPRSTGRSTSVGRSTTR
jgi:Isocitrate lyase